MIRQAKKGKIYSAKELMDLKVIYHNLPATHQGTVPFEILKLFENSILKLIDLRSGCTQDFLTLIPRTLLKQGLGAKQIKEILDVITDKIIPKIPKKHRKKIMGEIGASLEMGLNGKELAEFWEIIINDIIRKIPTEKGLIEFIWFSMNPIFLQQPTLQQMRFIKEHIISKIPKEYLAHFARETLPHLISATRTKQQRDKMKKIVDKLSQNQTFEFIADVLPFLMKYTPKENPLTQSEIDGMKRIYKDVSPGFFNERRKILRIMQERTGPPTTLLGGQLANKTAIRFVPKESSNTWQKAEQAGIPVEPILKKVDKRTGELKDRAYPTKDGQVRVSTKVMKGINLGNALHVGFSKKQAKEIYSQVSEIMSRLWALNISHNHPHAGNFQVVMEGTKPKVHLIDFDEARTMKTRKALLKKISKKPEKIRLSEFEFVVEMLFTLDYIAGRKRHMNEIKRELLEKMNANRRQKV